MVAFTVVMHSEFGRCATNRAFAKEDQSLQATLLDRAHESFCVGIPIRASCRQFHRCHTGFSVHLQELIREQRISVVDQVALALENTVNRVGQVAPDLVMSENQICLRLLGLPLALNPVVTRRYVG